MKVFNAIQIVILFSGFPFLLSWLTTNPFTYAYVAFWAALLGYLIMGGWLVHMVWYWLENYE